MMKSFLIIIIFLLNLHVSHAQNFSNVEDLINNAIRDNYFPGAQLLIANSKEVIYTGYFGKHEFNPNSINVSRETIYDLASLTKVIATTTAIMILYDRKLIDLDEKVSYYLPEFSSDDKINITVKNLLLHNSGLKAWLPFYKTCKNKSDIYNTICSEKLDYTTGTKYVYSDLGFILLGLIAEKISQTSLDKFCEENIFAPIGMSYTMFNPNPPYQELAAPTENDNYFRMKQIKGVVHDESAYIMGGVSGNAGLFSNVQDLNLFMRMLVNKGYYTDERRMNAKNQTFELIQPGTIAFFSQLFSTTGYDNSRALGWDTYPKPNKYPSQCGTIISRNCIGHTGFTGTSIWYDFDKDIYIIFLTNRIYPDRNNPGIFNFRPLLHDEIFKTLGYN